MAIISVSKKEDLGSCFQFFRGPQIGKRTTEYSIYVFKGLTNGWKTTKSISAQTERKIFFFFFFYFLVLKDVRLVLSLLCPSSSFRYFSKELYLKQTNQQTKQTINTYLPLVGGASGWFPFCSGNELEFWSWLLWAVGLSTCVPVLSVMAVEFLTVEGTWEWRDETCTVLCWIRMAGSRWIRGF